MLHNFPVIKKMPERAVVKLIEGEQRFTLSFVFQASGTGKQRQFNLNRDLSETIGQLTDRISTNVAKVVNKKKPKGKSDAQATPSDSGGQSVIVTFMQDSRPIDLDKEDSLEQLLKTEGLEMQVMDQTFNVVKNPPLVEEAKLSSVIMTDMLIYPTRLKTLFNDSEKTKFTWFVSESVSLNDNGKDKISNIEHEKWVERADGFFFRPSQEDLGRLVKLDITPASSFILGDTNTVIAKKSVEAGPALTAITNRHQWTQQTTEHPVFRVVTYNILADLYADSDYSRTVLHRQCPPYALAIDYRVKVILKELLGYNGDIICLQESDRKVFEYDILPAMNRKGFTGVFNKKGGQVDEGLACFYRLDRFRPIHTSAIVLSEELPQNPLFKHIWDCVKTNKALEESMLQRTTAAFFNAFASKQDSSKIVIVANTHLYFKPDADHVRLLQFEMCLLQLANVRTELMRDHPDCDISVVFCGDFNSSPPFAVVQYALEGSIGSEHDDWRSCEGEEVKGLAIQHPFKLQSAAGMPKYTNYTIEFKDCLDYIFYDCDKLQVDQVIPFPLEEELSQFTALPNHDFPSDHIAVVADLKWK